MTGNRFFFTFFLILSVPAIALGLPSKIPPKFDCSDFLINRFLPESSVNPVLKRLARSLNFNGQVVLTSPIPELAQISKLDLGRRIDELSSIPFTMETQPVVFLEMGVMFSELLLRYGLKLAMFQNHGVDLSGLVVQILGSTKGDQRLDRILRATSERFDLRLLIPVKNLIHNPAYTGLTEGNDVTINPRNVLYHLKDFTTNPPVTLLHEIQHVSHLRNPRLAYLNIGIHNPGADLPRSYVNGFVAGELETFLTDVHLYERQMQREPDEHIQTMLKMKINDSIRLHAAMMDVLDTLDKGFDIKVVPDPDGAMVLVAVHKWKWISYSVERGQLPAIANLRGFFQEKINELKRHLERREFIIKRLKALRELE